MTQKTYSDQHGLTAERLRELLDYEPESGIFRWRVTLPGRGGHVKVGKIAGSIDTKGKRQIRIDCQFHFAHRLAFLWMLGRWPEGETDHRNRSVDDNRWDNLREATGSQNSANRLYLNRKENLPRGVYRSDSGRLYAAIQIGERLRYLGYFDTAEAAHMAFLEIAQRERGEFCPI